MGMVVTDSPWQIEFETMEERCGYLLTSGLWSDCTFVVGPKTNQAVIPAHKLILAMASPVFEKMFYGETSEDGPSDEPVITIPDVCPEAFRELLPYIYTGNVNITSFEMAIDLLNGAKRYELPHLAKECNSYVLSAISPKNACKAYESSHLFEDTALVEKCIEIITTKTKEVLSDSSFVNMDINTLITVLSLDHLNVDSELDLFCAVERYADAQKQRAQKQISSEDGGQSSENPSEELSVNAESSQSTSAVKVDSKKPAEDLNEVPERPTIRHALQKIRFLTLTAQQFAEGPARSDLLTKDDLLALLMNIASNSSEPMPTGFSESREPRQPRCDSVPT